MKTAKFLVPMLLMGLLAGCGETAAPAPEPVTPAAAREAYVQVLETLLNDHILPDGTDCSADFDPAYTSHPEDVSRNTFAVQDVDGDGREELVLSYTTTSSANERLYVLDWDEETGVRVQLTEYPNLLAVYDNGAIQAGWSHNQGRGGRFWPYFLYTYDADTDSYTQVGAVDAWDSNIPVEGYPTDIDVSGAGLVYYIYEDMDAEWGKIDPVDESVYLDWLNGWLGDASPVDIAYLPLTEEHIQNVR